MKAGKYNIPITLQTRTTAVNSFGSPVDTWANSKVIWAYKSYKNTGKVFDGDRETSVAVLYYYVYYDSAITDKMRIVDDGMTFDIKSIQKFKELNYMILDVEL